MILLKVDEEVKKGYSVSYVYHGTMRQLFQQIHAGVFISVERKLIHRSSRGTSNTTVYLNPNKIIYVAESS